ncbi:nuclear cap-binding complex variant subunit Cbc3 [Schizosaccharomyces osmophilus]|uniref:Nuclear cap-binding complex variant subunit Cbc3 n=1 Tax=Schizosaccharomyces osmophilus TaxID=2545709 RepID=A0AAE9WFS6_9SCHI|nr:nuclear cap-binding complex variant subunit Cbc3 [Schizosaccharomyces osmophilus]WBW75611.1 nuclear cap-binding complex variant subunit Cbc3 [Schizosaccharomyces osmophilus]
MDIEEHNAPIPEDRIPTESPTIVNENPAEEPDDLALRKTALHVSGVDFMSEAQIKEFVSTYVPEHECVIEWINDNECNLVFPDEDVARRALYLLISEPISEFDDYAEHPMKPCPSLPSSSYQIRYARYKDKKVKSAHLYSRYYLFHGDPHEKDRSSPSQRNSPENEDTKEVSNPLRKRIGPKVSQLSLLERISASPAAERKRRRNRRLKKKSDT